MEFWKETQGNTLTLHVSGELDAVTVTEVRPAFDEVASSEPKRVIIDLSRLRLIDSSGVGAIVSLFKRVRAAGGQFGVTGVQGQPQSIFKVLRLDKVFELQ